MKNVLTYLTVCLLMLGISTANAQITEKPGFGKFAITGATIHTVTNGTIDDGIVLIDGNKIVFVGENTRISSDYEQIDASGKHVYPGFIDAFTSLGLVEIGAVPVTVDNAEIGNFNPNMMAFTAFNPHSASVPVTRVSGVTTVITRPSSGIVSGKAALMDLWGYSPDSMAVLPSAALVMNFPASGPRGWWDNRSEKEIKEQFEENITAINEYLDKARFYNQMMTAFEANNEGKIHPDKDPNLEAMREVVRGEVPIILSADREKDILEAIKWTSEQEDLRFILEGVSEGWRVAEELAESGLSVITATLQTPARQYDNYQRPYQNPGMMSEKGVKVLIGTGETENVRNAPFHAGYAATYGMGTEEAVKALTINVAEAFGVADQLGSIEEGKRANLFISDGDPFEPLTQIEQVFIAGYKIPMVSRHQQLYDEFLNRDEVNK